ncbi:Regulator of chromosome condensation RCC1 [Gracilaria domingensis]|nr:Regulator of chromosome condensation RCC1 [Gracilaria domingensis]
MPAHLLGWGSASDGQLGPISSDTVATPRPLSNVPPDPTAFTAGLWTSLIVSHNGAAVYNTSSKQLLPGTAVPPDTSTLPSIAAVAVGRDFIVLLTATGNVYTLGSGAYGQLGLGSAVVNIHHPALIQKLTAVRIVAICAAEFHWLALDSLGRVFACGANSAGQLGLGHNNAVKEPTHVTALFSHPIVAISTGDQHSAVLSATGTILCFGSNKHGQLGQPLFRIRASSLLPLAVSAPQQHLMSDESTTVPEHSLYSFSDIACGSAHTVALRSDGAISCWGMGDNGQLGTRSARTHYEPAIVAPHVRAVSVSAGERHSAALTSEGGLYLWGEGTQGQIGDGDLNDKYAPVALPSPKPPRDAMDIDQSPYRFVTVCCGGYHTLALAANDDTPARDAHAMYDTRIPRCVVDHMVQARAGFSRFGTASVLLRTFVDPSVKPLASGKVDYLAAENAHLRFAKMFGEEGRCVLAQAAARIRHDAQIGFGIVQETERSSVLAGDLRDEQPHITPKALFYKDDDYFRQSVANSYESGYLFFLAFMNPIYSDKSRVPDLSELAAILLRCEENGREAFLEMVSYCDEQVLLTRIIRPLQAVLTSELTGYRRITRNAIFATKALALCYHAVYRASKRMNIRGLFIPRREFYNDTVSELVDLGEDYERWCANQNHLDNIGQNGLLGNGEHSFNEASSARFFDLPSLPIAGQDDGPFSFCSYSFLLTEAAKFRILELESQMTMNKESMRSVLSFGVLPMPIGPWGRISHMRVPEGEMGHLRYMVLYVRRDNIVSDAFVQIAELVKRHPRELHKPLRVKFEGEEGVDEGGLRKEFYQVLLEHILSPKYGMFEFIEEANCHWFRKDFLESEHSWTLIGIIFGLAAFNSILLSVQFAPVFYRKLAVGFRNNLLRMRLKDDSQFEQLEYKADLNDVIETFPAIGRSLRHLREYEGDDVEEVFALRFEISYANLFGNEVTVELKENGASIAVTSDNREEFIELYVEYLINESIKTAFNNFAAGFSLMMNGPCLPMFTAEEIETLVCGEEKLDFAALRNSARYEGYDEKSTTVINLWQVLDEYDLAMKKLFLLFVTGSDRAPIGGLGNLMIVVQRAGSDTNRLPTSYTCFNTMLLPDYSSRAKLRDRLSTAIRNSKG